jgi:hypothetical protein
VPAARRRCRRTRRGRIDERKRAVIVQDIQLEVTSESTFETDTTAERSQYAAAGTPGYPVVQFDKDWSKISEIEEYRLDWSGRR